MAVVATVIVNSASVEKLLASAEFAVGPAGAAAFLGGPMQEVLKTRAQERFTTQGEDVSGGGWQAWEPLTDATIEFRRAQGFGPTPINVRTGELERYITQSEATVTPTATGALMTYPGQPAAGLTHKKVETAQVGKANPKTPPRPVLGLSTTDVELALVSMSQWIIQTITIGGRA